MLLSHREGAAGSSLWREFLLVAGSAANNEFIKKRKQAAFN